MIYYIFFHTYKFLQNCWSLKWHIMEEWYVFVFIKHLWWLGCVDGKLDSRIFFAVRLNRTAAPDCLQKWFHWEIVAKNSAWLWGGSSCVRGGGCVALNEHTWHDKAAQMSQLISATSGIGHTFLPESKQRQWQKKMHCRLSQGVWVCHYIHMHACMHAESYITIYAWIGTHQWIHHPIKY